MDAVLFSKVPFDFDNEFGEFERLFDCLNEKFGAGAFVKYRNGSPVGGVAPAYFEAVSVGSLRCLEQLLQIEPSRAVAILSATVESDEFRAVTGPGANSLPKMTRRIELVAEAFSK